MEHTMKTLFFLISVAVFGQTLPTQVPLDDHSGSALTKPFSVYATTGDLPATGCTGNLYASVTGTGLYQNMATGACSWVPITGGGGGSVTWQNDGVTAGSGSTFNLVP